MLTPLRAEVNALLEQIEVRRKPALRRSDSAGALLATDLPLAADESAVEAFVMSAEDCGWHVRQADNGWLLLDKPVPVPDVAMPSKMAGECGCCLSLLLRHPEDGDASELIREVVRAEEAGKTPFRRFCTALHNRLAAMLRLHQPLPGGLTPYLVHACRKYDDGRKCE